MALQLTEVVYLLPMREIAADVEQVTEKHELQTEEAVQNIPKVDDEVHGPEAEDSRIDGCLTVVLFSEGLLEQIRKPAQLISPETI